MRHFGIACGSMGGQCIFVRAGASVLVSVGVRAHAHTSKERNAMGPESEKGTPDIPTVQINRYQKEAELTCAPPWPLGAPPCLPTSLPS